MRANDSMARLGIDDSPLDTRILRTPSVNIFSCDFSDLDWEGDGKCFPGGTSDDSSIWWF